MPREEAKLGDVAAKQGTIASHRFPGGHTWMAAMRGDAAQLAAETAMLRGAASMVAAYFASWSEIYRIFWLWQPPGW
jgi:hypothetical protein